MRTSKEMDPDISNFVKFGRMLSEESRSDMVETVFHHFCDPTFEAFSYLKDTHVAQESLNWTNIMKRYLQENINRVIFIGNETLSTQVTKEFIHWAKNVYNELIKKGNFQEREDIRDKQENFQNWMKAFASLRMSPGDTGGSSSSMAMQSMDSGKPGGQSQKEGDVEASPSMKMAKGKAESNSKDALPDSQDEKEIQTDDDADERKDGEIHLSDVGILLADLTRLYPSAVKKWKYYEMKVQEYIDNMRATADEISRSELQREFHALIDKVFDEWHRLLENKQIEMEKQELKKSFDHFIERINEKYTTIRNLHRSLSPILGYLGRFWSLTEGIWQQVDWTQLEKYARILKKDKKIQQLAELLGRAKEIEKEYEEEKMKSIEYKDEWKVDPASKSEIIGIHASDDISNLLPSEVALLSDPSTELIFSKKFVEKKLLTFQYHGEFRIGKEEEIEKTIEVPKKQKKGPIICCVDTSGSMAGIPERIAKTIVFAILKIALRDERKCYLISFSTSIQTIELSNLTESLETFLEFLGMGFYGGTDSEPALVEALRMLEKESYIKADILVVSDFIMDYPNDEMVKKIRDQISQHGTKFHSLIIGNEGFGDIQKLFTNNWQYNLESPASLKEIIRDVQMA